MKNLLVSFLLLSTISSVSLFAKGNGIDVYELKDSDLAGLYNSFVMCTQPNREGKNYYMTLHETAQKDRSYFLITGEGQYSWKMLAGKQYEATQIDILRKAANVALSQNKKGFQIEFPLSASKLGELNLDKYLKECTMDKFLFKPFCGRDMFMEKSVNGSSLKLVNNASITIKVVDSQDRESATYFDSNSLLSEANTIKPE